jgi:Tubulin-tyrosine ligase family
MLNTQTDHLSLLVIIVLMRVVSKVLHTSWLFFCSAFSEETPGKMINQFPFEMVLTVKSMLPVVCRRGISPLVNPDTLDTYPPWLPITFNLKTEIAQFVSYFQHREARFGNYNVILPARSFIFL